ncbi:type II toxin-antitoxin system HicA family toxin [Patescibacteria group bacterium]|nr:type II toxin-antitoxin system HicA family toxin [Patescibacteria group bacterium]MBU1705888.1 type II toxin-antitoxin system HicA family toxin [Patescibacteria group bacterium]
MKRISKKQAEHKKRPNWGDLIKEVKAAGGIFVRQNSTSHQIWRLPNGRIVILLTKHLKEQVNLRTCERIRQRIRQPRTE